MSKPLWYIVNYENDDPITFGVGGVVVSPYLYSSEGRANLVVNDSPWPEEVGEKLVVRPGPHERFMSALMDGFPNTKPAPPDCISINSEPGKMLSGLVPLTERGAALADKAAGTTFWTTLAQEPGMLKAHALEMIQLAVGLSAAH